jgi:arylformamidase
MRLVDLTQPLYDGLEGYPGDPGVSFAEVHDHAEAGYRVSQITLGSHVGSHLDVPAHVRPEGSDVGQLQLDRLVGPARVVDLGELAPREEIPLEAVRPHLGRGRRVLLRTGWDRHYGGEDYYTGYPQVSPELAAACARAGLALLGLEQPSVHHQHGLEVHRTLLDAGCIIVEGLTLRDVADEEVFLVCLPLPLAGRDGAPLRAVALEGVRP